jgi:DNA repair protein RecO (recombination protein O)
LLYETRATCLAQTELDEFDKIITLFTRDYGLVRAVVKGARRPSSKLSGVTQPFSAGDYQLHQGRSLDRVIQVANQKSYPGLSSDYKKMIYAGYVSEMFMTVIPEREANQAQYDFLDIVLKQLEDCKDSWTVIRWTELGVLKGAGLAPSLNRCTKCGKYTSNGVWFSYEKGGIVCENCHIFTGSTGKSLSGVVEISLGTRKTIELLLDSVGSDRLPNLILPGPVRNQTSELLRNYVMYAFDKRFRSMPLVESIECDNPPKG